MKLANIKINSFVTTLGQADMHTIHGGAEQNFGGITGEQCGNTTCVIGQDDED